jgi:hypothetical protein
MDSLPVSLGLAAAAALVAAWKLAPESRGTVYDIPPEAAEARLKDMAFDDSMLTGTDFSVSAEAVEEGRAVRWRFGSDERREGASSCTVTLAPTGQRSTRARLGCEVDESGDPALAAPAGELLELIVSEHVRSTLTGRPFDHDSMGTKLIGFSLRHRGTFARQLAERRNEGDARSAR